MAVDLEQTIVAISSAPGEGARIIVRLSGSNAISVARSIVETAQLSSDACSKSGAQVTAEFVRLPGGRRCQASFWTWPTARSYTRQPQVEIHLSGSRPIADGILLQLQNRGARLAQPGEFTMRAFLAGRLDLTQAEAVLGLIDARGDGRFQAALKQLAGGLSGPLQRARLELIELLALLEAGLDFAEEDIEFITPDDLAARIEQVLSLLVELRKQIESRRYGHAAPRVVLLGLPNAGKSTLFNRLAGRDEAITSAIAGTTRDFLAHTVHFGDMQVELVDTAGHEDIDNGQNLQKLMAAQTALALEDAELCLLCVDATLGMTSEVDHLRTRIPEELLLTVYTKSDAIPAPPPGMPGLLISASRGEGIETLKEEVRTRLLQSELARGDLVPTTAARCLGAMDATCEALSTSLEGVRAGASEELTSSDIRVAIAQLAEIVGAVYTDDLLDIIFSRFCIGK